MATTFTRDGAERIIEVTRLVERDTRNPRQKRGRSALTSSLGFWAQVTANDATSDPSKYSWITLEPTASHDQTSSEDWGDGTADSTAGYAIEARYQSEYVIPDTVVWMTPAKNQDFFLFEVSPDVQVGYLDKDGTMTGASDTTCGSGDIKLASIEWDSTNEVFTCDVDGTNTVTVHNAFSDEIIGDGTNDQKVYFQFGQAGAYWLTALECGE
ncbi:hypothetical protein [Gimesia maris]|uniref:hypothetical protein n=1 Tax=Gimesia maris TaxID=122 RepID=UPI0030D99F63|tara:strand:- start:116975 stop:117610 length:636 start_codon:yes stop_codon:yes gene_type:complete